MSDNIMIPPAVLLVEMNGRELKLVNCTECEITVWSFDELNFANNSIILKFFCVEEYGYSEIEISDSEVLYINYNGSYWEYKIKIRDEQYSLKYNGILEQLDSIKKYDDSCNEFYDDYESAKIEWFGNNRGYDAQKDIINCFQQCFLVENFDDYKMFLDMPKNEFVSYKLKNYYLNETFLAEDFSRVYIGNQYCHNLFPGDDMLLKLMKKALSEKLEITIAFTYIREIFISKVCGTIDCIFEWCVKNDTKVEVIVNDWGMLEVLSDKLDRLTPVLGVLLNKRKKDPRTYRKIGLEKYNSYLEENNLNAEHFCDFLKKNGIERIEYESHGVANRYAILKASISFPYYQTNTSQYCPLYAQCVNLNRNYQKLVTQCPKYCRKFAMMFPKNVKAIGRYNSIFGIDNELLRNEGFLKELKNSPVDRLVLNI
ncbi:hypothetical protein [Sellimonas intestinalis]|uniref:hypothetical protein n=1 Tax=Sellimonas intestinalis TaxID=1653434 RepID=UPI0015ECA8AD|nr:hypothetical protein [Sellimonas intestinalis]MBA2213311.1 hypothetical protein [Sellimonas intestinalis]